MALMEQLTAKGKAETKKTPPVERSAGRLEIQIVGSLTVYA